MQFRVIGDHCPITGNLVTARTVNQTALVLPNGNSVVYAEGNDYAALERIAVALRASVTHRKRLKARKAGK